MEEKLSTKLKKDHKYRLKVTTAICCLLLAGVLAFHRQVQAEVFSSARIRALSRAIEEGDATEVDQDFIDQHTQKYWQLGTLLSAVEKMPSLSEQEKDCTFSMIDSALFENKFSPMYAIDSSSVVYPYVGFLGEAASRMVEHSYKLVFTEKDRAFMEVYLGELIRVTNSAEYNSFGFPKPLDVPSCSCASLALAVGSPEELQKCLAKTGKNLLTDEFNLGCFQTSTHSDSKNYYGSDRMMTNPLVLAIRFGNIQVVKFLLEKGEGLDPLAEINLGSAECEKKKTILEFAMSTKCDELTAAVIDGVRNKHKLGVHYFKLAMRYGLFDSAAMLQRENPALVRVNYAGKTVTNQFSVHYHSPRPEEIPFWSEGMETTTLTEHKSWWADEKFNGLEQNQLKRLLKITDLTRNVRVDFYFLDKYREDIFVRGPILTFFVDGPSWKLSLVVDEIEHRAKSVLERGLMTKAEIARDIYLKRAIELVENTRSLNEPDRAENKRLINRLATALDFLG